MAQSEINVPVVNRGERLLQVGIEPEGDCVSLKPGQECVVEITLAAGQPFALMLEIEGDLLLLHSTAQKEIPRRADGRTTSGGAVEKL